MQEKQLQPRPITVLNYQAKGAPRKTETERVRHAHRDGETQRDSEREHAVLVQRESKLTMDE